MATNLLDWALPRLKKLLPLDDESLTEILSYTTTLSKDTGAVHLQNILGDSPQALDFISSFNFRRQEVTPPKTAVPTDADRVPRPAKRQAKARAPLHQAGPVRRPEGYGDTSGAYHKQTQDDAFRGAKKSAAPLADSLSLSSTPEALQLPRMTQGGLHTPSSDRSRDPSPALPKLPPSASGSLISDLPNVRQKTSKKPAHGTSTPRGKTTTTSTSSVNDLTAAIAALELSTNPTLSSARRRCECNASIHPLFITAPNCLNCGKIICALEGLQPCSYCDSPILTRDQVSAMIQALKSDRSVEKIAVHNAAIASGKSTPLAFSTPDSSGDEGAAAVRARQHRDKLLAFQRENAQRTRVHDEAADYDTSLTPGATQWMNPVQRAAALKKQQQYLRELAEANRPEYEKRQTVMSLAVKNGKLVKTYERAPRDVASTTSAVEQDDGEADDTKQPDANSTSHVGHVNGHGGKFSENPLISSSGLTRPVWKPKGDVEETVRQRPSVWRRVQDDNTDNERYILDGGLYGHSDTATTRLMEDGSQQECG